MFLYVIQGKKIYCVHSSITGPSLDGLLGREAGTARGFGHYSEALRRSGLIWDGGTVRRLSSRILSRLVGLSSNNAEERSVGGAEFNFHCHPKSMGLSLE